MGLVPALDQSFNIGPLDVGGDQTTVNNSEFSFNDFYKTGSFLNVLGPSMRMIVSISDITHPITINSTGQSGQPLHPNYSDQAKLWQYGDFKNNTMDESDMIRKEYELLKLMPSN